MRKVIDTILGLLCVSWILLLGYFIFAGYTAAFTTPESVANRWEDAAGFTFIVLIVNTMTLVGLSAWSDSLE